MPNPLTQRLLQRLFEPRSTTRWVEAAAHHLGRSVRYVDMYGFQREIVAATEPVEGCLLAYVESQARERRSGVEVAFHLLVRDPDGSVSGTELESYNPYFGCEVGYLGWCGDAVILVYREKHHTYACRSVPGTPATFVRIAGDWVVTAHEIAYRARGEAVVRRLSLPEFDELSPLSFEEARAAGLRFPPDAPE